MDVVAYLTRSSNKVSACSSPDTNLLEGKQIMNLSWYYVLLCIYLIKEKICSINIYDNLLCCRPVTKEICKTFKKL